jgi:CO dehydrogenase maturation factor
LTYTIALAGKGGVGKTSVSSLIIRQLLKNSLTPVLAVDADANANLGESLGLDVLQTVGGLIASFNNVKLNLPPGMTKEAYLEYQLNTTLAESKGLDMISMGRGEGDGCYCYPNSILRSYIDKLSQNYRYVVMDNEAGMEHLSRRTTQNVDHLFIVSDHSVKGVRTLGRIRQLVDEMKLNVSQISVIINMVTGTLDPRLEAEINKLGIAYTDTVPADEMIREFDLKQTPLLKLPDNSPAVQAVAKILSTRLGIKNRTEVSE